MSNVATSDVQYTCDRRAPCGCSKQSTTVLSKIIGGEPVKQLYTWGWIASLRQYNSHRCGATVITPLHVITAAHCVGDITLLSSLSLNFGITQLADIGQLRNVTKIYIHPAYDAGWHTNDLAILRLDKPLALINSDVSSICLPSSLDFNLQIAEYPPIGNDLVAIGWGTVEFFEPTPSPILRQVSIQAIARTEESCINTINNDSVQFCAGLLEGGKDTCKGDSGGPLMLFKDRLWHLVGVTSYGQGCGSPGFPGIYTRIAYYDLYIKETIKYDIASISNTKQMFEENQQRSNTKSLYQKSLFKLLFICLFLVYKKLFYYNQ